jgi:hypothetical protein
LNRSEYQNAIRDLLAVEVDVHAFASKRRRQFRVDNVGVSNLSATLLERYLAAAQKISRLAVGIQGPATGINVVTVRSISLKRPCRGPAPGHSWRNPGRYTFPLDGKYEIRFA